MRHHLLALCQRSQIRRSSFMQQLGRLHLGSWLPVLSIGLSLCVLPRCSSFGHDPHKAELYYQIGANQLAEGNIPDSIGNLQQAFALDSTRADIATQLGVAYMRAEQYSKAEESLKHAYEINPQSPEILNNLAVVYLKKRQPHEAAHFAQEALKILTYTTPELAWANLAQAQAQLQQFTAANRSAAKAVEKSPENCSLRVLQIRIFSQNKDYEEAAKNAHKSVTRCPFEPSVHLWEGYAYARLGQRAHAEKKFNDVVALFKNGDAVDLARESLKLLKNHVPLQEPQI